MSFSFNIKHLHHAYLIPSYESEVFRLLQKELFDEEIFSEGSPDLFLWEGETFGIDDARWLKGLAFQKGTEGRQGFLVRALSVTIPAQNALLKLFEEPPHQTHFFVCIPKEDMFISTLRSRMVMLPIHFSRTDEVRIQEFLEKYPGERIKILASFFENEAWGTQDKLFFLDVLEKKLAGAFRKGLQNSTDFTRSFGAIQNARAELTHGGGSAKLLFENIALILPSLI